MKIMLLCGSREEYLKRHNLSAGRGASTNNAQVAGQRIKLAAW